MDTVTTVMTNLTTPPQDIFASLLHKFGAANDDEFNHLCNQRLFASLFSCHSPRCAAGRQR